MGDWPHHENSDRVREGNSRQESRRDEEMMLQESKTTFENQCKQKTKQEKQAWNVKDSRERGFDDQIR